MRTYLSHNNLWISEIRISGVVCICEANARRLSRRGALEMARRRAGTACNA